MAVVDRVLPWRRPTVRDTDAMLVPLIDRYTDRWPKADVGGIRRAYAAARDAHAGQRRRTGEEYIHHPVAVAEIVADMGLDEACIMAALLHDAVEDTVMTLLDVKHDFGEEVASLVDGVTKLDRIRFESKEQQQAATMRKMLVAMSSDLRVLLIKLADRLHNMRTLAVMTPSSQERIARETLDIYAPLANRLGMQEVKTQLEELAFSAAHPARRYAEIDHMVATRAPERDRYLEDVVQQIQGQLSDANIDAIVTGRKKDLWSIYEKMVVKGKDFNEIFDLIGIRVIVHSIRDTYAALGQIHAVWKPVQGRFKDYVAMPKFNLYRSLHTTVVGPAGKTVEVQIRTVEMHHQAEFGVAAHWQYKARGGERVPTSDRTDLPWLNRIVDWQKETADPEEFMESLKIDLDQDEVFVFTPRGDVMDLPIGATPIDFAYSVHTDVGHATIGARINGRLVPLDYQLSSGDTVEVFTSKVEGAGPSRDWLASVATPRARNKIRQWFARERRDDAIENGKEELLKALRRQNLPAAKVLTGEEMIALAEEMNFADLESLFASVGEGHTSARSLAQRITRSLVPVEKPDTTIEGITTTERSAPDTASVHVEGLDDVMVRLARCCTPVPGDGVIGFVTRGRGVSVHRTDCANAASLRQDEGERVIDVEWQGERKGNFVVGIEVKAFDRAGLLMECSQLFAEHRLNILTCVTSTSSDRVSRLHFELELGDPGHLESLMRSLRRVDGVYDVYRLLPGAGPSDRPVADGDATASDQEKG